MNIKVAKLGSKVHHLRIPRKTSIVDAIRRSGEALSSKDNIRVNGLDVESLFDPAKDGDIIVIVRSLKRL